MRVYIYSMRIYREWINYSIESNVQYLYLFLLIFLDPFVTSVLCCLFCVSLPMLFCFCTYCNYLFIPCLTAPSLEHIWMKIINLRMKLQKILTKARCVFLSFCCFSMILFFESHFVFLIRFSMFKLILQEAKHELLSFLL